MFKVEGESIVEQLSEFRKQRAAWQQEIDAELDGYHAMQEEQVKLADRVVQLELREIKVRRRSTRAAPRGGGGSETLFNTDMRLILILVLC